MDDRRNYGMGSLLAFILGGLIGAAAMFLSREDNRQLVRDKMRDFEKAANEKKREMKERTRTLVAQGAQKVDQALKETEDELEEQKSRARKATQE